MTRAEALRTAAAVIARGVADLPGLALLLDEAGLGRLSAALRPRAGGKGVGGAPRPDAGLWAEAARRMVGR